MFDSKLRYVRHMCRGAFGVHSLPLGGLKGEFPRGSKSLWERGILVKSTLLKPGLGLEPMLVIFGEGEERKNVTPADLAGGLEPELTELGRLVDSRFLGNREIEDVRSLRKLAGRSSSKAEAACRRRDPSAIRQGHVDEEGLDPVLEASRSLVRIQEVHALAANSAARVRSRAWGHGTVQNYRNPQSSGKSVCPGCVDVVG